MNSLNDLILNQDFTTMNIDDAVINNLKMSIIENVIKANHAYNIYQGKDMRWYTYIPDDSKPNKRKKVAKKSLPELQEALYSFYKSQSKEALAKKVTLRGLYPDWLAYKELHTNSSNYIRRIDDDWRKYYLNDDIIDVPIIEMDKLKLDVWAHSKIKEYNFTKKSYYNITVIIRQALEYAVEQKIIKTNPMQLVKINSKLFQVVKKKESSTQVYYDDEKAEIIECALKDFWETRNLSCLGIPLSFQLGLRIGELCALKWSDIISIQKMIVIQRTEVKEQKKDAQGKWLPAKIIIVEHTKSSAGNRTIILTNKALQILETIKETQAELNHPQSEYIFTDDSGRITSSSIDSRIRKYCRQIDMPVKSNHKIRKTVISTLIDSSLNINEVRVFAGHEDERTSYNSYCFNRMTENETRNLIENAL